MFYFLIMKYIIVTVTNIQVNCNGFDDVEIWTDAGKEWIYCRDGRPTTYTFVADGSRWLGISRLGRVSMNFAITFSNTNNVVVTNPPIFTLAPVTNSPITNPQLSGCKYIQIE